jgi:hypothetical protein
MIQKNVDLIAIALLLICFGFCSHLQGVFVHGIRSSRTVWVAPHSRGSSTVIRILPCIPFVRD